MSRLLAEKRKPFHKCFDQHGRKTSRTQNGEFACARTLSPLTFALGNNGDFAYFILGDCSVSFADLNRWLPDALDFWAVLFFVFGCVIGSFLNLCIQRLPLGQSLLERPPQCLHCHCSIPWLLIIAPLRWLCRGGKCRECGTSAPIRSLFIELLTGVAFLSCWLVFGPQSAALALFYCLFLAGLIVATVTDFDHFIIPDEITVGGMIAGVVCSVLLPGLHGESTLLKSLRDSLVGLAVGGGGIYAVLQAGKMAFGRQRIRLPSQSKIRFSETAVHLPDRDIPFDELFYRKSDAIAFNAETVELADRCYRDVRVRLSPEKLEVGNDQFNPEEVPHMEAVTAGIVFPREAMGLGDAKLMAAIGAFLGWEAVVFTLIAGSFAGSIYGIAMIVLRGRRTSSGHVYFGPFLALGAALWVFAGPALVQQYQRLVSLLAG